MPLPVASAPLPVVSEIKNTVQYRPRNVLVQNNEAFLVFTTVKNTWNRFALLWNFKWLV